MDQNVFEDICFDNRAAVTVCGINQLKACISLSNKPPTLLLAITVFRIRNGTVKIIWKTTIHFLITSKQHIPIITEVVSSDIPLLI